MAKENSITEQDIIKEYMNYVLMHNRHPNTVFSFTKDINIEEQKFYEFFTSFDSLEQSIFKIFFDNAHSILEKSDDYLMFDARNKLLSFYYTFFEILTANRSYVLHALGDNINSFKSLKTLVHLKNRFTNYIDYLNINTFDFKQDQLTRLQKKSLKESAWLQLLVTIKFWIDDTSPSFEKTDLFIEKSVKVSFDLLDTAPLKSIMDLGKFIYKEKMHMN